MAKPAPSLQRASRGPRRDALHNREQLLRAATVTLHREGAGVPMAAIAAEAGVGVGTLYRHFADREAILDELTDRSFEQLLLNAVSAEARGASPVDSLRLFIEASISQRFELVLPLHGGPAVTMPTTRRTQKQMHDIIGRLVERGKAEGSIRADVEPYDIIVFGSMLSQPGRQSTQWDKACQRLLRSFLQGLAPLPGGVDG